MNYLNIAGYKFVELTELPVLRSELLKICRDKQLKGTILLAKEGINISLAGASEQVEQFKQYLSVHSRLSGIEYKHSWSSKLPFLKMWVRLKKEIITLGQEQIETGSTNTKYISPKQFQTWLEEHKEITVLDTRNKYEVELGTFNKAIHLDIDTFGEFPEAAQSLDPTLKDKPIVMFCTGGVRCEKAAPVLEQQGFTQIFQLEGGILQYFAECGGEHYQGNCFVFDERVAITPALKETHLTQCRRCANFFSAKEQTSKFCEACLPLVDYSDV